MSVLLGGYLISYPYLSRSGTLASMAPFQADLRAIQRFHRKLRHSLWYLKGMEKKTLQSEDGELCGLRLSDNGRRCSMHVACGKSLQPNDVVRFVTKVVDINGEIQEAVAAIRLDDGTEQCTVGFLPSRLTRFENDKYVNKHAMIIEVYDQSEEKVKTRKSDGYNGAASFGLLEDIPRQE